ncbi:hypothetical protein HMPREF0208_04581 [Citrobacter koseri]|uniref:Uncharacterized protein n=1 Tax=Citrobacter koseri (strain ATCC BAA-895 / CDC 4225-83 / SGSC4696) TaxID=290338 RepID=A8AIE3_CITK8|nr:hypothetical protein CKO_02132 [Citrobacter koseri ATCC BAA-895]KWZ94472.1 hypothetical protein HMPREF3220_04702 [Citrobacter koseri]KWZ98722.1 hypothetical protein HMPREF3207_04058 [Citrobacter koseri]KXB39754.1 hypothetical protein HMPREF0208_04581 [Citrobacter koseri]
MLLLPDYLCATHRSGGFIVRQFNRAHLVCLCLDGVKNSLSDLLYFMSAMII